ncbi:MAG TPA: extracellular solute-binding protein [Candidatus Limnocylindria bacterium]
MDVTKGYDRRAFLKLMGVGSAAAVALAACGGTGGGTAVATTAGAAATTAAPTAAKPTGSITVYSALNESTNDQFSAAFKAAYPGTTLDLLRLPAAGDVQTRIRAEKASPKADVFIGGSSEFHDPLGKEGLLEKYESPNAKDLKPEFKDPAGFWVGWYTGIFGFVIRADRLKEAGGKAPATWDDLLDPAWKGKLILPDPVKTGGGYIFIATQIFRFNKDEAKAMAYMKSFHANVADYIGTSPGAIGLVSQGQYVGCPNWAHDILTEKVKNPGVDLAIPKDTGFEVGAVSIVKGSKNLPLAKAFIDWTLTPEAGALNVKLSNRGSTIASVAPAPGAPTLASVSLVNYDRQWATDNKDRILKLWQSTVGR